MSIDPENFLERRNVLAQRILDRWRIDPTDKVEDIRAEVAAIDKEEKTLSGGRVQVVLDIARESLEALSSPSGMRVPSNICKLKKIGENTYQLQHAEDPDLPFVSGVEPKPFVRTGIPQDPGV